MVVSPAWTTSGAGPPSTRRSTAFTRATSSGGRERLGEVVVAAELEPEHAVDLAVARGEEDDGDLRRLPQALHHLEAVDVGEPDVEHDEAWPVGADRLEAALAGRRLQHPVALAREIELDEVGDVRFVVDDEDRSSFHGSMVARRVRPRCEADVSER